jgi:hypothetical protein
MLVETSRMDMLVRGYVNVPVYIAALPKKGASK